MNSTRRVFGLHRSRWRVGGISLAVAQANESLLDS